MDINQSFRKGDEPVTFTLPTGKTLPTDMSIIMKKAGRFFSINDGMMGVSFPKCEGDGCECVSCESSGCMNCLNFTTSTDNIQCNKDSCERSNDVKYFASPLYPEKDTYLSEYNPKFKFIKIIPSFIVQGSVIDEMANEYLKEEKVDAPRPKIPFPDGWTLEPGMTFPPGDFLPISGTIPPGETPPPGWEVVSNMLIPPGGTLPPEFLQGPGNQTNEKPTSSYTRDTEFPSMVVFAITYPSIKEFDTSEKFYKLYNSIMFFSSGFLLTKQPQYIQHNIAVFQKILKINNLPKTLLDPKKLVVKRENSNVQIIEKYDNDNIQNLVIPDSPDEDTDPISDDLITPEPDDYVEEIEKKIVSTVVQSITTTTAAPTTKPKGLSTGAKVGIGFAVIFFIALFLGGIFYSKSKKRVVRKK